MRRKGFAWKPVAPVKLPSGFTKTTFATTAINTRTMDQGPIVASRHARTWQRLTRLSVCFLALGVLSLPCFAAQQAGNLPTLTYTKVMKGSVPEYTSITVNTEGNGSFDGRQLSESPNPRALKLSAETTQSLFRLAGELGDFRSIPLASHRKVANMGLKTFIYQHDGKEYKAEFNYTQNKRAQQLLNLFEGIADVEEHIGRLEYSSRYDVLGLPSALTQVEIDLDNNNLVDPQLMVPILKKIAGDSQYLHIAQLRAADILRRIQDSRDSHKPGRRHR